MFYEWVQCSIYYVNTNEVLNCLTSIAFCREQCDLLCSHSNGDLFKCEDYVRMVFDWCLYNNIYYLGILSFHEQNPHVGHSTTCDCGSHF